VFASARPNRIALAELSGDAVYVVELFQRRPSFISCTPARAWSEPDGKGLRKILVGMLLRVPAFDVADKVSGKGDRTIIVAVSPAIRTKHQPPFRSLIEPVGIVEGVARLMAQVHHDLA